MTEPAVSLAFFDGERGVHGSLRSGVAVLFEGDHGRTLDEPPEFTGTDGSWSAAAGDELSLEFEASAPGVDLGGTDRKSVV